MIEQIYKIFREHPHISTDTRKILPDSIFFALRGRSFDGNEFARSALEQGAAYCVVDCEDVAQGDPRMIVVEDTLRALQDLARHHRAMLGIEILAITGSNGKTTTKELISRVLGQRYRVYATRGNLNNHIGVPLTLLAMDASTEFGIVEMGASSRREIGLLCDITQPNYGVITNIGRAHLEGFGGAEGVMRGKGELLDYLEMSGGEAFIASENDILRDMAAMRSRLEVTSYDYSLANGVESHLEGEYNRFNIAAAVAIGRRFGVDDGDIHRAIESYKPRNNRSQMVKSERNRLIIDCYNANPSSMEASLRNFVRRQLRDSRAKIAILGDMYELGEWSLEEHRRVVDIALRGGLEQVILVGAEFGEALIYFAQSDSLIHFDRRSDLEEYLRQNPIEGCSILIKGSRGVGLENIIALL